MTRGLRVPCSVCKTSARIADIVIDQRGQLFVESIANVLANPSVPRDAIEKFYQVAMELQAELKRGKQFSADEVSTRLASAHPSLTESLREEFRKTPGALILATLAIIVSLALHALSNCAQSGAETVTNNYYDQRVNETSSVVAGVVTPHRVDAAATTALPSSDQSLGAPPESENLPRRPPE